MSVVVEDVDGLLDDGVVDDCLWGEVDVEVVVDIMVDDIVLFFIYIFYVII